jgi:small subunit ribosomal protein S20
MANHPSAEKRNRQNAKRAERNRVTHGTARTAVKKARAALATGAETAAELINGAEKALARAASKGSVHKKTASRTVSRLRSALHKASNADA